MDRKISSLVTSLGTLFAVPPLFAGMLSIGGDATPASANQLDDLVNSTWIPQPAFKNQPLSFNRVDGGFQVSAPGTCNGIGSVLAPDAATLTLKVVGELPTTLMACEGLDYEMRLQEVFASDVSVTFDGNDRAKLVNVTNPRATLTLQRVG